MRYQIGQELFGVQFTMASFNQYPGLQYQHPLMRNNTQPTEINFNKFTVTEHHKVHSNVELRRVPPEYDGYLLKDSNDIVFANQYPRASYANKEMYKTNWNEGDFRFYRHVETEEGWKAEVNAAPTTIFEYHCVKDVLERIGRGITDLDHFLEKVEANDEQRTRYANKLRELRILKDRILTAFKQKYPQYRIVELHMNVGNKYVPRMEIHRVLSTEEVAKMSASAIVSILDTDKGIAVSFDDGGMLELRVTSYIYIDHHDEKTSPIRSVRQSDLFYKTQTIIAALAFKERCASKEPRNAIYPGQTMSNIIALSRIIEDLEKIAFDALVATGKGPDTTPHYELQFPGKQKLKVELVETAEDNDLVISCHTATDTEHLTYFRIAPVRRDPGSLKIIASLFAKIARADINLAAFGLDHSDLIKEELLNLDYKYRNLLA